MRKLRRLLLAVLLSAAARNPAYAEWFSISFDPLTLLSMILSPGSDKNGNISEFDKRNLWLCFELNFPALGAEMGAGVFARMDRVALRVQYRSYWNNERFSGFFWGLFTVAEWRKLWWMYDSSNELSIGWGYPFIEDKDNYNSVGFIAGGDIGLRLRAESFGVSVYAGLGFPLFYMWGSHPPEIDMEEFRQLNFWVRAIDIGIRLDFAIPE